MELGYLAVWLWLKEWYPQWDLGIWKHRLKPPVTPDVAVRGRPCVKLGEPQHAGFPFGFAFNQPEARYPASFLKISGTPSRRQKIEFYRIGCQHTNTQVISLLMPGTRGLRKGHLRGLPYSGTGCFL